MDLADEAVGAGWEGSDLVVHLLAGDDVSLEHLGPGGVRDGDVVRSAILIVESDDERAAGLGTDGGRRELQVLGHDRDSVTGRTAARDRAPSGGRRRARARGQRGGQDDRAEGEGQAFHVKDSFWLSGWVGGGVRVRRR